MTSKETPRTKRALVGEADLLGDRETDDDEEDSDE
jgi:hypothetical protein